MDWQGQEDLDRYPRTFASTATAHAVVSQMQHDKSDNSKAPIRSKASVLVAEIGENPSNLMFFLHSRSFKLTVALVIFISMGLVVYESDRKALGKDIPIPIEVTCNVVLAFYILELSLRVFAYGADFLVYQEHWFDAAIVCSDVVLTILQYTDSLHSRLSFIRIFRALRIVRVFRVVILFPVFKELYLMIHGLMNAGRALFWATVLVFLLLTMWAIIAVDLLHPLNEDLVKAGAYPESCKRCREAFQSVARAVITFTQTVIAGDSWGEVTIPMVKKHPWTIIIFVSVIVTVQLGLLNLILAVIVDRAMEARKEDLNHQLEIKLDDYKHQATRLKQMCHAIDVDCSGTVDITELKDAYRVNKSFYTAVSTLGMNNTDLDRLFDVLDDDQSGAIDYEEFVERMHQIKSADTRTLLVFIRHCTEVAIPNMQRHLNREVHEIRDELRGVVENLAAIKTLALDRVTQAAKALPSAVENASIHSSMDVGGVPENGCTQNKTAAGGSKSTTGAFNIRETAASGFVAPMTPVAKCPASDAYYPQRIESSEQTDVRAEFHEEIAHELESLKRQLEQAINAFSLRLQSVAARSLELPPVNAPNIMGAPSVANKADLMLNDRGVACTLCEQRHRVKDKHAGNVSTPPSGPSRDFKCFAHVM